MTPPPLPSDEVQRLHALRGYDLLDTLPEQSLDDLTSLAAQICEVPIALISLVDAERQWFKSKVGMSLSETPRDISFCGHAILQPNLFIIPDATQDDRFADNPLVTESRIRFYAGAPLITPSGHALGALCIMDHVPRQLTAQQQAALLMLARQVMSQLELRRQTNELRESEARLHIVTENARVGLFMLDRDRRYLYASKAYAEILGLTLDSIIGKRLPDLLADIYEMRIRPQLDRAFAGEQVAFETIRRLPDGDHYFSVSYEPRLNDGAVTLVVSVITDITERKHAEEALRQSELARRDAEERWQFAVLAADMGVWDWNLETNVVYHSERWCTMLGYEPGEITDQLGEWSSRMHPQDLDSAMARLNDHLEGRTPLYQSEHRMRTKDGQYRWIQDRAKVMARDATGRPLRIVGTHTDITDRKSSELASQRLVAIVESSDDAIIGKDLESIITSWNRGAEKIFGYTAAEIVGTSILRLIPENRYAEESYILDRIKLGKSVEHFETMRRTKTGSLINVSVTASPIKDATGKVIGVSKVARDISARKRIEERANWLATFPERNPNFVLELDLVTGLFHYLNPSSLRQFPDLHVKGIHHPLVAGLAALMNSSVDWQPIHRELTIGTLSFSQMITFDPDSQRVRIYSSDITARKQAENALRIQQEHSQSLLQLSRKLERVENYQDILSAARETVETVLGFKRLWIYQLTDDGKYLKLVVADDGMTKVVRAQDDDLLLIAGDPMLEEIAACRDIVVVEDALTDPRTNKDIVARLGNHTIVNVPVMLAGKTLGTIGTGTFGDEGIRPISSIDREFLSALASHVAAVIDRVTAAEARLVAEHELRISEERLRTVTDTAQVGLVIVDQEHRYRYANPSYARILRLPTHELVGQKVAEVLPAMYPTQIAPRLKLAFAGERVSFELTIPASATEGEPRYFVVTYEPTLDPLNPLVVVVIVDITERKMAELSSRESEARFRQLAENINEVFWITDPTKNEMLYISPAYEKIWGRTCASLNSAPHTWLDVIHPEDRQRVLEASQSKQAIGEYDEVYRITRPDGSVRWINDRAFPIRNAAGQVHRIVGTAEDITARRQLEEQFRQAQKMEAIGQLAGGVAHDFNNILAAIMMQTEMAIMEPNLSTDLQEGLRDIRSAADRAANLTRQLLLFSRKQVMNTCDVNLNDIVLNLAKMLQRIIGEHLSLQYNLHPGQLTAHADAGMLDQVLLNLVVNARDAMPMGGRILIATFYKTLTPEEAAAMPDATPGNYVCLRVSDTGCGISAENFPHIFEPFFTTKGPGKGTGLGLATVFGIVKQHGGAITVQSQVDHGTTFQIFLPAVRSTGQSLEEAEFRPKVRGGTETILLVEDDPSVRILTSLMLERSGYKVLAAPNGVQALKIWELHKASISLLLTDIVMPEGVNGIELASRLQAQRPQLKVILTSGYSADIAGRDIALQEGQKFIQKPSPPNHILETIRQSLDSC